MTFYAPIPSAALRVVGSDRVPFVHGQVSNDVRGLPTPGMCRSAILNAKGQVEYDVRIYRREADLYLHAHAGLGSALLERLQRYVVFDDVELTDITDRISVYHVSSDITSSFGFAGGVQLLPSDFGTLLIASVARGINGGADVHVLRDHASALEAFLGTRGTLLSPNGLELARLRAGLPDAHLDGFLERLPQECGLESAVSYKKGCYIGQEIMARLEARGNTRYALQRVALSALAPVGSAVTQGGKSVGQLGANLHDGDEVIALAVLRRDLEVDAALEVHGVSLRVFEAAR
jgi:tRNA-modifying protein YgfZ